jgi:hypothetical protein
VNSEGSPWGGKKKIQGQSEVLADRGGKKNCRVNNPQIFLMCGQLEAHWRKVHKVNQDLAIWQISNME